MAHSFQTKDSMNIYVFAMAAALFSVAAGLGQPAVAQTGGGQPAQTPKTQAPKAPNAEAPKTQTAQPVYKDGPVGPPITFKTREEYLYAARAQDAAIPYEESSKYHGEGALQHPYQQNPFVKKQTCKMWAETKEAQITARGAVGIVENHLTPGETITLEKAETIDFSSAFPIFRKAHFGDQPNRRTVSAFTIRRVVASGGPEMTGVRGQRETIYEVQSKPDGAVFLAAASGFSRYTQLGIDHPKWADVEVQAVRKAVELEADIRKKYLDDYGINAYYVELISSFMRWKCTP